MTQASPGPHDDGVHPSPPSLDVTRYRLTRELAPVSGPEAALDARLLLEHATGRDRTSLLRDGDQPLDDADATRLANLVHRRLAREPVWRILGTREFWGLPLTITPDVLDPRPDTETLISAVLDAIGSRRTEPLRVADLGTGSGAILCALLSALPRATGWGVDRSEAASRVARHNAARLGFADRCVIVNGHWSDALGAGVFDLVVSNPPYIETAIIAELAPEVRDHDPHQALDGGIDGLMCYQAILADLPRVLAPNGTVAFEIGVGQASAVMALVSKAGLMPGGTRRDLGGQERVIMAGRD